MSSPASITTASITHILRGLPATELRSILTEYPDARQTLADECAILSREIDAATAAGSATILPQADQPNFDLAAEWTFPTEFATLSALLGRLPPNHLPSLNGGGPAGPYTAPHPTPLNQPAGTATPPVSIDFLLLLHKKLCNHHLAGVFKRPVTSREAPGYDQKIMFPMDLSLIRKVRRRNTRYTHADKHGRV